MRTIETTRNTKVEVMDEKGQGNGNHHYRIAEVTISNVKSILGEIRFQNGPINKVGVNGATNEDLIAIVIDRLQGFQSGEYACRDNALALTKLEEALMWLRHRTEERETRGVEGTHTI